MRRPGVEAHLFCVEKDDANRSEESQDARREREHCGEGSMSCQSPAVSDKRSNAQARMTMNQQSMVFDTDYDIEAEYKILKRYQRTRENSKDEGKGSDWPSGELHPEPKRFRGNVK